MSIYNSPEAEDNIRVRKAAAFLEHCRKIENEARRALAEAIKQTAFAKRKHE